MLFCFIHNLSTEPVEKVSRQFFATEEKNRSLSPDDFIESSNTLQISKIPFLGIDWILNTG
jgi:hypothetical protein